MTFEVDNVKQKGLCANVSESGILARFKNPIEIWTEGDLALLIGGYYVNIAARVVRTQHEEVGLAFLVEDDNDRLAIRIMVDFARTGKLLPLLQGQFEAAE